MQPEITLISTSQDLEQRIQPHHPGLLTNLCCFNLPKLQQFVTQQKKTNTVGDYSMSCFGELCYEPRVLLLNNPCRQTHFISFTPPSPSSYSTHTQTHTHTHTHTHRQTHFFLPLGNPEPTSPLQTFHYPLHPLSPMLRPFHTSGSPLP